MFINTYQILLNYTLNLAKQLAVFILIIYSASLYAWLDNPADLYQDIVGDDSQGACAGSLASGYDLQVCHKVVLDSGSEYDRCDTPKQAYAPFPANCHRWNLIWQYGEHELTKSWPVINTENYRLPTYKELAKLILNEQLDDSIIDLKESIVGSWVNVSGEDVWFISSSYAKGTGTCGNHIYGVNASTGLTGRFKLNEVEVDDGAGGTTTETQWRQLLSTKLEPTSCEYSTDEPNIHALTVNKSTVKELM